MGSYDRDYSTPPRQRMVPGLTPVTKWLLISNVVIFVLDFMILPKLLGLDLDKYFAPLTEHGAFFPDLVLKHGQIWRFITFQFLHGSVGHILMNSIGLYFAGPWMERWWGAKRFLAFYLLCGVAGAFFYLILLSMGILPKSPYQIQYLVGASAGIYGALIGIAVIAPASRVRLLFPPVEMSLRTFAIAILAIAVGSIVLRLGGNEGGEAGHLGGAVLGFVLVRYPFLLGKGDRDGIIPPSWKRRQAQTESKLRPRTSVDLHTSNEIDRILDKINREGLQSLTEQERETLRKASNS